MKNILTDKQTQKLILRKKIPNLIIYRKKNFNNCLEVYTFDI